MNKPHIKLAGFCGPSVSVRAGELTSLQIAKAARWCRAWDQRNPRLFPELPKAVVHVPSQMIEELRRKRLGGTFGKLASPWNATVSVSSMLCPRPGKPHIQRFGGLWWPRVEPRGVPLGVVKLLNIANDWCTEQNSKLHIQMFGRAMRPKGKTDLWSISAPVKRGQGSCGGSRE